LIFDVERDVLMGVIMTIPFSVSMKLLMAYYWSSGVLLLSKWGICEKDSLL
jgi:hypothetical protein